MTARDWHHRSQWSPVPKEGAEPHDQFIVEENEGLAHFKADVLIETVQRACAYPLDHRYVERCVARWRYAEHNGELGLGVKLSR